MPADMTIAVQDKRRGRHVIALGALALAAAAWAGACASTESVSFSDGDCVAGGCQHGTTSSSSGGGSSSSGGMCTVNQQCSVSWANDIFAGMLDTTTAACTATGLCHGSGKGNLQLTAGDAHGAYTALMGFTLASSPGPALKAIVPCDKVNSGLLCNFKTDTGVTNPFGQCGSGMPVVGTNLTVDQINTIADWIACGAPEN